MNNLIFNLAFHRTGKPREWLRFVLFKKGWMTRPMFHRIVHKKNGRVRPRFAYWVNPTAAGEVAAAGGQTQNGPVPLRAQEMTLRALTPLDITVEKWRGRKDPTSLLDKKAVIAHIAPSPKSDGVTGTKKKLLIAVGQNNYHKVQGGVQLCIQRDEMLASDHGYDYLQIHPWHPLPRLSHCAEDPDYIVTALLNGTEIGACRISDFIAAMGDMSGDAALEMEVVVHHLLGHQPEQIANLVLATKVERCVFWLHDFFSICPSYTLQRNTLSFCNAPDVGSNACTLCLFGKERRSHQARMMTFFENINIDIIAPSTVTAALWKEKSGLRSNSITVIPHVELDFVEKTDVVAIVAASASKPITIGYLGTAAQHKGWPDFVNLMHLHSDTPDYRFVVLSNKQPRLGEDKWVAVNVTAQTPDAMSVAVKKEDIDIVLHWPECPETFSFTTFEALAGSAYVLTNRGSGNVAAAVEMTGRGDVLRDAADLRDFFTDGRAQTMADHRRAATQSTQIVVQPSQMSYSLLEKA